jgi:hypothetical protein
MITSKDHSNNQTNNNRFEKIHASLAETRPINATDTYRSGATIIDKTPPLGAERRGGLN